MISFHSISRVELTAPRKTGESYTCEIKIHMTDMSDPVVLDLFSDNPSSLRYHDASLKTLREVIREMAQSNPLYDSVL